MSATYGITGKLSTGIGASWVRQSSNPSTELQRAQALDATGNEVAAEDYDSTDRVSEQWMAKDTTALDIPDLGDVVDDYVVTAIEVATSNTGFATLSIEGHKHTDGTPSYTAATGFAALITSAYGALELSGGTGTLNSSSIRAECQHAEAKGATGDTVAGENYNAQITVTQTYIDGGALGGTYMLTSSSTQETNTGYQVKTLTGAKKLTLT